MLPIACGDLQRDLSEAQRYLAGHPLPATSQDVWTNALTHYANSVHACESGIVGDVTAELDDADMDTRPLSSPT